MKLSRLFLGASLAVLLCPFVPRAQEPEQHKHDMGEKLGVVNFTVSCNSAAQQQFNRAVALLHSFWYEEAAKAFFEVTKTDPKCGMGYWGIAMSFYHPVWSPPVAAELRNGSAAVQASKRGWCSNAKGAGLHRGDRSFLPGRGQARSPDPRPRL